MDVSGFGGGFVGGGFFVVIVGIRRGWFFVSVFGRIS